MNWEKIRNQCSFREAPSNTFFLIHAILQALITGSHTLIDVSEVKAASGTPKDRRTFYRNLSHTVHILFGSHVSCIICDNSTSPMNLWTHFRRDIEINRPRHRLGPSSLRGDLMTAAEHVQQALNLAESPDFISFSDDENDENEIPTPNIQASSKIIDSSTTNNRGVPIGITSSTAPEINIQSDLISPIQEPSKSKKDNNKVRPTILIIAGLDLASPSLQTALLEAIRSHTISIDGIKVELPREFSVIATRLHVSPMPLPLLDSFLFEVVIRQGRSFLVSDITNIRKELLNVHISHPILQYIRDMIVAARVHGDIAIGPSPKGADYFRQASRIHALFEGSNFVRPIDTEAVALDCLAHRMLIRPGASKPRLILSHVFEQLRPPK